MREDVKELLSLQETDQTIKSLKADIVRIPQLQKAAKERLANDTAALASAKLAYQENEVAIKNVELDIGTRKNSIERLNVQQFETKKNEEYTKLGEEVIRYAAQVDNLETRELELMELADRHRASIESAKVALAKTQTFVDEEITELETRLNERKKDLADTESLRAGKTEKIEDDLLATYIRLFDKRKGDAVMHVTSDKSCTSCHIQVTPATYAAAQSGAEIAHCDNCGAILFSS